MTAGPAFHNRELSRHSAELSRSPVGRGHAEHDLRSSPSTAAASASIAAATAGSGRCPDPGRLAIIDRQDDASMSHQTCLHNSTGPNRDDAFYVPYPFDQLSPGLIVLRAPGKRYDTIVHGDAERLRVH
jgi:hypothetical protein